jgi:hypothetical protein
MVSFYEVFEVLSAIWASGNGCGGHVLNPFIIGEEDA